MEPIPLPEGGDPMDVVCPRCKAHIEPNHDRCPNCGLTVEQLDHHLSEAARRAAPRQPLPLTLPSYYSMPTYGRGPVLRGMGPAPTPARLTDVHRDDAVINLTEDGDAEVLLTSSGKSLKLPPAPAAPQRRHVPSRAGRRFEMMLLVAVVLVACTIVAALLRLST
jgi:hypothetical protein